MQRILIADSSPDFSDSVSKQLGKELLAKCCHDGREVLKSIHDFDPEILLLDMMLPGADGFSIIDSLRATGKTTKVIAILPIFDEFIMAMLSAYNVSYIFRKPCSPDLVASFLRQYAKQSLADECCAEAQLDSMLLRMGFNTSPARYVCLTSAILLRYRGEDVGVTKGLYSMVAKLCGGSAVQVEKSIRDTIRHAWKVGDRVIWNLYFPQGQVEKCPTNDMFISRMAYALHNRERARKPDEHDDVEQKIG